MPHYKLTPRDLENANWRCSTHKANCYVNAENEREARRLATAEFWIAGSTNPDGTVPRSPWNDFDLVDCTAIASLTEDVGEGIVMIPRQWAGD